MINVPRPPNSINKQAHERHRDQKTIKANKESVSKDLLPYRVIYRCVKKALVLSFHPLKPTIRIGVLDHGASLDNRWDDADARFSSIGFVGCQGVGPVEVLVDNAGHPLLAVVAGRLSAVVPDGVLVLDDDLKNIVGLGLAGQGRLEAREERDGDVGVRNAGSREGGLGDGVVLGQEVPFHHVTDFCDDVLGVEE